MIRNRHNWLALYRALWVFSNPVQFAWSLLRKSAPPQVRLRTPTGAVTLHLRNFESLKTAFSVFCRGDYHTETDGHSCSSTSARTSASARCIS